MVLILSSILCFLINIKDGYNYISALANVVIATSAVMAYLTARNYLPQLTTQEGYKIAIQMVNNELQSTAVINMAFVAAKKLDVTLMNFDGKRAENDKSKTLRDDYDKFKELLDSAKTYENRINNYISTMTTYGLKPAPDREVDFNMFCQNINNINVALLDIKIILQAYIGSYSYRASNDSIDSYTKFSYINNKESFEKIKNALQSLASAHNKLESNRLSFFGEKKQIGKLFVVNLD